MKVYQIQKIRFKIHCIENCNFIYIIIIKKTYLNVKFLVSIINTSYPFALSLSKFTFILSILFPSHARTLFSLSLKFFSIRDDKKKVIKKCVNAIKRKVIDISFCKYYSMNHETRTHTNIYKYIEIS